MNTSKKHTGQSLWLAVLLLPILVTGCFHSSDDSAVPAAAPTVTETSPTDTAIAVPINSKVTATFSEAMDTTTIDTTSFTLAVTGGATQTGDVSYDSVSKTASFTPTTQFTGGVEYTATLTSNVTSSAGIALAADYDWTFTGGSSADVTAPTVISTSPADGDIEVPLNRDVRAVFSEALDPVTVNPSSFTLRATISGTEVSGAVSYSNKAVTFNPTNNLADTTEYTAKLTTGITDLASTGNTLSPAVEWAFETGDAVAAGPAAINLKTAANFAIMTGTGITSASASAAVTGNIGASGITGASITVACSELLGVSEIFTDNAEPSSQNACLSADKDAAGIALADVLTAYTAASAPTTPAGVGPFLELGAGTVTAQTLVPGVYTWAGNVSMTGDITLHGGANDVWVFQIDGTLDMATTKAIILTGDAQARNVFWRVADVVTLNQDAVFKGIVLAKTKVAMITGASIEGRLLAQTEVNLGSTTTVTQP